MKLRKANIKDSEFFFNLRNSKSVRINSFNKKLIKYENHLNWYKDNLKKKTISFYIIENVNKKSGYLRLEKKNGFLMVSIAIHPEFRRKKLAYQSLLKIEKKIKSYSILVAELQKKNKSSFKLFKKAGYVVESIRGNKVIMKKKI